MFKKFIVILGAVVALTVSASAVDIEFLNNDGSESFGVFYNIDNFITYEVQAEDNGFLYRFLVDYTLAPPDYDSFYFEIFTNIPILGWSLEPYQTTPYIALNSDWYDVDFAPSDEPYKLYLAQEIPEVPKEPLVLEFVPLSMPSGWIASGVYSVNGSPFNYSFQSTYPTEMQVVSLDANYNTFRPEVALAFHQDLRNKYFSILVRQAWYIDGDIPSDLKIESYGLDGYVTVEKPLSEGGVYMYSLGNFEYTSRTSYSVDRVNGIVYFDYDVSVYIPDTVPEPEHSYSKITFYLKHNNVLSGLNITEEDTYTQAVSVFGNVTEYDVSAVRQYQQYQDKSNSQMQKGEEIIKDIESLVKPEPDKINPDQYLPETEDLQPIDDVFGVFFQNAFVVQLCMMCLGFAFVSYVLFGKKG